MFQQYYQVGDQIFLSKTSALIEATRTNTHPTWQFHTDIFNKVPWQLPSGKTLNELYLSRAKLLREKYDYIVVMFSGGSDSTTVVNSFVDQNLPIDELVIKWPVAATENKYQISGDTTATNFLSEWNLRVLPAIKTISNRWPEIKITIDDWSSDLEQELIEDDWSNLNDWLNPGVFRKYGGLHPSDSEVKMIDAGKKTAVIWGVDKPKIIYRDGRIYTYFLDKLANTKFVDGSKGRISELFFWSEDCPEIAHAQARIAYEYFVANPDRLSLIDWNQRASQDYQQYTNLMRKLVYPDWNSKIFQADKIHHSVYAELDSWMFQSAGHTRYMQSWQYGLDNLRKAIDPKYQQFHKDGKFDGWVGFISPFYDLGPAGYSVA